MTRQKLRKPEDEGDCSPSGCRKILLAVRHFYTAAVEYIKAKAPLFDEVLVHAKFANFERWGDSQLSDVEYFMRRYERVIAFDAATIDEVFDEFDAFEPSTQTLDKSKKATWEYKQQDCNS